MYFAIPAHQSSLLLEPEYYRHQLDRIRPQIKFLGTVACATVLLLLPWDFRSDSAYRNLAMLMRVLAILPLCLIAVVWSSKWLERHFLPVLLLAGLGSFLCMSANYILLPERTGYLFTVLFYYSIAFLTLAPLAGSRILVLAFLVPISLVYAMLYYIGQLQASFIPFSLHALPLLFILSIAAWYARHMAQEHFLLYRENVNLAAHDELTGLHNRRAWTLQSENLLSRARRENGRFALMLVDIDHFKVVNDTHGHPVGDEVLRQLGACLQSTLRDYDVLGRLGGEEFVISATGMDAQRAWALGERLRRAVERMQLVVSGNTIRITISIGIACLDETTRTLDALVELADRAMYQAKRNGRNRVEVSGEPLQQPVDQSTTANLFTPARESVG
jgi:diguanylate cyclase